MCVCVREREREGEDQNGRGKRTKIPVLETGTRESARSAPKLVRNDVRAPFHEISPMGDRPETKTRERKPHLIVLARGVVAAVQGR